jgi:hypothetical protein
MFNVAETVMVLMQGSRVTQTSCSQQAASLNNACAHDAGVQCIRVVWLSNDRAFLPGHVQPNGSLLAVLAGGSYWREQKC